MIKVNNAAQIAKRSEKGMKIYYDFEKQTANTSGKTGHYVTYLLRKCTAEEIRDMIYRWSMM